MYEYRFCIDYHVSLDIINNILIESAGEMFGTQIKCFHVIYISRLNHCLQKKNVKLHDNILKERKDYTKKYGG